MFNPWGNAVRWSDGFHPTILKIRQEPVPCFTRVTKSDAWMYLLSKGRDGKKGKTSSDNPKGKRSGAAGGTRRKEVTLNASLHLSTVRTGRCPLTLLSAISVHFSLSELRNFRLLNFLERRNICLRSNNAPLPTS